MNLPARRSKRSMLRRRGWLGGWVSFTRRYSIKTAKPI